MSVDAVGSSEVIIISSTSSNAGTYRYGSKVYTAAIAVTLIYSPESKSLLSCTGRLTAESSECAPETESAIVGAL